MLGGIERRVIQGEGIGRVEEGELGRGEVHRAINKLKGGKAMGIDEIPGEVWKCDGREIESWLGGICNRIWRGEGWPEEWREGIMVSVRKKG